MPCAIVLAALLAGEADGGLMTQRTSRPDTAAEAATPAAVPVDKEPLHKPVLRNDYVVALHVTIAPGQSTALHTHAHDGAAIRLTEATVGTEVAAKGKTPPQHVRPGDVSLAAYASEPLTHRVENLGPTTFEVIDLEFLKRPDGPQAAAVAPPAAENDTARIYRWTLAPGASTPSHTHERPYVIVAATPMSLLMTAPDGRSMEHPVKAGDVQWVNTKVTHSLTNHGKEAGVIVEVELK